MSDKIESGMQGVSYRDKGQQTVEELIASLQRMPSKALVWTEGCDCWGDANKVKLCDDGSVLITRAQ